MKSKLFLTVLLLAAITTIGISQDEQSQAAKGKAAKAEIERLKNMSPMAQRLYGFKCVWIRISELSQHTKDLGFTEEYLKTYITGKLALAGIKLWDLKAPAEGNRADLIFDVRTFGSQHNSFFYLNLSIHQFIRRKEAPGIPIYCAVYNDVFMGSNPSSTLRSTVQMFIDHKVDLFVISYLDANPKK